MSRVVGTASILIVTVICAFSVAVAVGNARWSRATASAWSTLRLAGDREVGDAITFDPATLETLPPPVARYFTLVLTPGQRLVRRATIQHAGDFALQPDEWKSFTSRQLYSTRPRGFIWDADIRFLPFVTVRVRDSYIGGEGAMLGTIAGVVTVVDAHGTASMAEASLLRYLAELTWLPTALLPGEGVQWSARDDSSATVSMVDGEHAVSLDVYFGTSGAIRRIAGMRGRDVKGMSVPTAWEGEFSDSLLTFDGMRIPATGQVSWLLPEGRHTYWRGRVVDASFEYRD